MTVRYLTPEEQAFAAFLLERPTLFAKVISRALQHWPVPKDKAAQQERRDLKYARAWLSHVQKDGDEG